MTALPRNHYVVVDITLKERGSSSTQVWRFCNRPIVEKTTAPVFPVLKEISGLEVQLGTSGLPNKANGSIVLRDNPGTIGQDRRFVDILQRWEIVERPCTVRILALDPSAAAPTASEIEAGGSIVWTGKIINWDKEVDGDEELLTLETEGIAIERRSTSLVLDSTYTDEPSATGKNLPIVFSGNTLAGEDIGAQVQAYSSGSVNDPNVRYYYAAGLGDDGTGGLKAFEYPTLLDASFPPTNEAHVWLQTSDRGYENITTSVTGWNPVGSVGATTLAAPGTAEYAITHKGYSGIVLGVRISFNGLGVAATPGGQIIFKAYEGAEGFDTVPGGNVIAQGIVEKSVYHSSLSGSADFWVECRFDQPVIVPYNSGRTYWYSFQLTSYVPGSDFVPTGGTVFAFPVTAAQRGSSGEWSATTGAVAHLDYLLCDLAEGWTGPDANGLTAWYLELQPQTPPAHAETPDLSKLDIVIATDGILDATNNGVGAGAGAQIQRADHAVKLLARQWVGFNWEDVGGGDLGTWNSQIDEALGVGASYPRTLGGYIPGDATADDLIERILEEHSLKYVPVEDGYALWAWGVEYPTAFVFTDENSRIEKYRSAGKETVVNEVEISANPLLIVSNSARQSRTKDQGYAAAIRTSNVAGEDQEYGALSEDSIATYGRNRNKKQEARLLYDATSARSLAQYLVRNYDRPDLEIEWSCPYQAGINDLPVASVVEIVSTALPAYFGANPEAQAPSYNGELTTLFGGIIPVRAERYRVHILGKKIEIDEDGFRLIYRGRAIGAYHPNDPT